MVHWQILSLLGLLSRHGSLTNIIYYQDMVHWQMFLCKVLFHDIKIHVYGLLTTVFSVGYDIKTWFMDTCILCWYDIKTWFIDTCFLCWVWYNDMVHRHVFSLLGMISTYCLIWTHVFSVVFFVGFSISKWSALLTEKFCAVRLTLWISSMYWAHSSITYVTM